MNMLKFDFVFNTSKDVRDIARGERNAFYFDLLGHVASRELLVGLSTSGFQLCSPTTRLIHYLVGLTQRALLCNMSHVQECPRTV